MKIPLLSRENKNKIVCRRKIHQHHLKVRIRQRTALSHHPDLQRHKNSNTSPIIPLSQVHIIRLNLCNLQHKPIQNSPTTVHIRFLNIPSVMYLRGILNIYNSSFVLFWNVKLKLIDQFIVVLFYNRLGLQ